MSARGKRGGVKTRTAAAGVTSKDAAVNLEPNRAVFGPIIYNLFPLLVGPVSAWKAELPRIAAMNFDWVYLNPFHEAGPSGSLYAIRDTSKLDPRFRDAGAGTDDQQIQSFIAEAARNGLRTMTDLVITHTSKDAVVAQEHPELFRLNQGGAFDSQRGMDADDSGTHTACGAVTELDYSTAPARKFLVDYWDAYIARMQALGVRGFRCTAAHRVSPEVWLTLISRARQRDSSCMFAADTLGCPSDMLVATASAGFDYLFNSFAWWDFHSSWLLEERDRTRLLAPTIAFPENHDMERVAASMPASAARADVEQQLSMRYALAAFFSSGVLMPVGYEHGARRPLDVAETTPASREQGSGIDISQRIAEINALRRAIRTVNVEGAANRISAADAGYLAFLRLDAGHVAAAKEATLIVANTGGAGVTVNCSSLLARTGSLFGPFLDRTPSAVPLVFEPGASIVLAPYEIRVFVAERSSRAAVRDQTTPQGAGRVIIEKVEPELDGGRTPIKRIAGEAVEVSADIFSDGHDQIEAELLFRPADETEWRRVPMRFVDNDRWAASFPLERNIRYLYTIEAWRDPFASWQHEIEAKLSAGVDVRLESLEGLHLLQQAAEQSVGRPDAGALRDILGRVTAEAEGSKAQLAILLDPHNARIIGQHAPRLNVSRYQRELTVIADRLAARFSAWYEMFPRSASNDAHRHGTFDDVVASLPYVQGMGFEVLYFPPIHPIGTKHRKGKNNSLKAEPGDVGSVYAIGSAAGGHDAIHPDLGDFESFRRLVDAAHAHGLEIALDFAIQCSPDHPWITQHPEWFEFRPDGTMKYAENPPKKYEDIYNVQFYGASLPSLWYALRDVVLLWCRERVRIFRVDNPHTKPLPFWTWLIAEVNAVYPDAIFLAEAFTRPKMMQALAKAGFQQSYTYFTWRNSKAELIQYMTELSSTEMAEYYRPNFFTNTPDINPIPLQTSGPVGFIVRGTLAATLSSAYGIYSGFELAEATPIPGREEYLDSEKYQIRVWDRDRPGNIRAHITKLNQIRRDNPALWDFRNITFLNAWNDQILAYSRMTPERDNMVMVLVNLDPHSRQECTYEVPLWEFGLPDHASIEVEDLLQNSRFRLHGKTHRIALDPARNPVVIWRLIPPPKLPPA